MGSSIVRVHPWPLYTACQEGVDYFLITSPTLKKYKSNSFLSLLLVTDTSNRSDNIVTGDFEAEWTPALSLAPAPPLTTFVTLTF